MAAQRRRGGAPAASKGVFFPVCRGFNEASLSRFGHARRAWPPAHMQVAHPSLGLATVFNGSRRSFSSRATLGDLVKGVRRAGGGGGGSSGKGEDDDDAVTRLIDKYGDGLGQVGFGGVVGFCSGYAMVKVGKAMAFVIGLGFVVAQGLNYSGVVTIKWDKVEGKAKSLLDSNNDNKLDKEDAKAMWKRIKAVLTKNLPAGGGFASGFAVGLLCG